MAARRRPREDDQGSDDEYAPDDTNVTVDRGSSVRRGRRGDGVPAHRYSPPPDFNLGSSTGPSRPVYAGAAYAHGTRTSTTTSDSTSRERWRPSGGMRINMTDAGPQKTLFLSGGDSLDSGSGVVHPRLNLPELGADAFASVQACAAADREMLAVVQKDLRKLLKDIAKDDWQYAASTSPFL